MNHTFDIKVTVKDEQINDIMSSALTGMTYWADKATLKRRSGRTEANDPKYVSSALTHGCSIVIHDAEENKNHELTLTKFLKGLAQYPAFDYNDYDMYDAERVVQYALFGEVVYA